MPIESFEFMDEFAERPRMGLQRLSIGIGLLSNEQHKRKQQLTGT